MCKHNMLKNLDINTDQNTCESFSHGLKQNFREHSRDDDILFPYCNWPGCIGAELWLIYIARIFIFVISTDYDCDFPTLFADDTSILLTSPNIKMQSAFNIVFEQLIKWFKSNSLFFFLILTILILFNLLINVYVPLTYKLNMKINR